jgi:hypothetical protein
MQRKYFLTLVLQLLIFSISNAHTTVTVSGIIKAKTSKAILPFVNVILKTGKDSVFVSGTVTNEEGRFYLSKVKPGNYLLELTYIGYLTNQQSLFIGNLSAADFKSSFVLKVPPFVEPPTVSSNTN